MLLTTLMSEIKRGPQKALWDCRGLRNTLPEGTTVGSLSGQYLLGFEDKYKFTRLQMGRRGQKKEVFYAESVT